MISEKYIILQITADTSEDKVVITNTKVLPAGKDIIPRWWIENYLRDNNASFKSPIYTMLKKWEKENE